MSAEKPKPTLLQGSLDLLILRTLVGGPRHGYAIARHLHVASEAFLQVEEGSLYPALHRLEKRGWVTSEWGPSEANRRAKFYSLTSAGRKRLQSEMAAWLKMSEAVGRILSFRPGRASS